MSIYRSNHSLISDWLNRLDHLIDRENDRIVFQNLGYINNYRDEVYQQL